MVGMDGFMNGIRNQCKGERRAYDLRSEYAELCKNSIK